MNDFIRLQKKFFVLDIVSDNRFEKYIYLNNTSSLNFTQLEGVGSRERKREKERGRDDSER